MIDVAGLKVLCSDFYNFEFHKLEHVQSIKFLSSLQFKVNFWAYLIIFKNQAVANISEHGVLFISERLRREKIGQGRDIEDLGHAPQEEGEVGQGRSLGRMYNMGF